MKEIKTLEIPIEEIEDNPFYARRFEEFDDEDIKHLAKSFEKSGQLQPIIVRENFGIGKKYQLVAGTRRKKAFQLIGKDEITAKVVEANDVEARIMSLAENYHRKDLDVSEKEKSVYKLWLVGKDGIFHNNLSIMEEWTGVPHQILSDIVNAEKEKEIDDSEEIRLSTSKDLQRTRILKDIPEVRKELLKGAVIRKTVKILEITDAAKVIKNYIDELPNDILVDIAKLFTGQKIKINNLEDFINLIVILDSLEDRKKVINKIKKDTDAGKQEKIDIFKFRNFVDIYMQSFDDVKEGLLNNNFDLEDAKHLNLFDTRPQREKILKDLRDYDKEIRYIEKEKIKYIQEKKRMIDSLGIYIEDEEGEEDTRTLIRIGEEENKVVKHIFKIRKDLLFFGAEEIESYDLDVRQKAIDLVWEVYNRYHEILVELGEIDNEEIENV